MRKALTVALTLLFSPLWPLGFTWAIAHAAFMGGYDAAIETLRDLGA
jgi:hypothetical protein